MIRTLPNSPRLEKLSVLFFFVPPTLLGALFRRMGRKTRRFVRKFFITIGNLHEARTAFLSPSYLGFNSKISRRFKNLHSLVRCRFELLRRFVRASTASELIRICKTFYALRRIPIEKCGKQEKIAYLYVAMEFNAVNKIVNYFRILKIENIKNITNMSEGK